MCALFIANQISSTATTVSLTQLLKTCCVKLTTFCLHLRHLVSHLSDRLPPNFSDHVKAFQASLLQIIAIFGKYEKLYSEYVLPANKGEGNANDTDNDALFGGGWLLYLAAKAEFKLHGEEADLHDMYILLLCVVRSMMKPSSEEEMKDGEDSMLDKLCTSNGVLNQELVQRVRSHQINKFQIFVTMMKNRDILHYSKPDFSDLFDPENIEINIRELGRSYDTVVCSLSTDSSRLERSLWLDERLFLEDKLYKSDKGGPRGAKIPHTTRHNPDTACSAFGGKLNPLCTYTLSQAVSPRRLTDA